MQERRGKLLCCITSSAMEAVMIDTNGDGLCQEPSRFELMLSMHARIKNSHWRLSASGGL